MARTINLALFFHPDWMAARDLADIREEILRVDRRVRPFVFPAKDRHRWTHMRLLGRRTVSVEFARPVDFHGRRAVRLRQLRRGKLGPSDLIRDAGLPIPRYEVLTPETRLDPAEWGPYVVVKSDAGGRGAYVRIQRTERVRFRAPEELDAADPGRKGARLVQRFVHSGPYPVSYRVLTLFGEPLLSLRYQGSASGSPVDGPAGFRTAGGVSIVASAKGCRVTLCHDEDLLALARRVHAVFPTVPVLGQDFVRDAATGALHVLEVNPDGRVWNFSGRNGRAMQREFGLDFYRQFDAMRTAARTLVEVARRHAG